MPTVKRPVLSVAAIWGYVDLFGWLFISGQRI